MMDLDRLIKFIASHAKDNKTRVRPYKTKSDVLHRRNNQWEFVHIPSVRVEVALDSNDNTKEKK